MGGTPSTRGQNGNNYKFPFSNLLHAQITYGYCTVFIRVLRSKCKKNDTYIVIKDITIMVGSILYNNYYLIIIHK